MMCLYVLFIFLLCSLVYYMYHIALSSYLNCLKTRCVSRLYLYAPTQYAVPTCNKF